MQYMQVYNNKFRVHCIVPYVLTMRSEVQSYCMLLYNSIAKMPRFYPTYQTV